MKPVAVAPDEWFPAPAKLNLFLHITGRRPDGYHNLQTLFQFLDWGDRIRACARSDGDLLLHGAMPGVAVEDNLVLKAAQALKATAATSAGADLWLDKQLPMGAGLGGGSSDAATTLILLNHLWQLQLSQNDLLAIALRLGADVPVFIKGQAAWAEGVGELLTSVDIPQPCYLLLIPACSISTAALFADPALRRDHAPVSLDDYHAGRCDNDFWPCVREHYPEVRAAHAWLSRQGPARLTGTGSALFAPMQSREQAENLARQAPAKWCALAVQGCNTSPLLARSPALGIE